MYQRTIGLDIPLSDVIDQIEIWSHMDYPISDLGGPTRSIKIYPAHTRNGVTEATFGVDGVYSGKIRLSRVGPGTVMDIEMPELDQPVADEISRLCEGLREVRYTLRGSPAGKNQPLGL